MFNLLRAAPVWMITCLMIFPASITRAQSDTGMCGNTLRMAVSTVKRNKDYLEILTPFINSLAEPVGKKTDVTFTGDWSTAVSALHKRQADLTFLPQSLLKAVYQKPGLKPVVKIPGADIFLFTRRDSGIASVDDLRGKRVAVLQYSGGQLIGMNALSKAGILEETKVIELLNLDDVFMGLFQNRHDAVFIAKSTLSRLEPAFQKKLDLVSSVGTTSGLYLYASTCVSDQHLRQFQKVLTAQPADERVSRFIRYFNFDSFEPVLDKDIAKALKQAESLRIQ